MIEIAGVNLQDADGRNPIGSGFDWMTNADSHDSRQFPTLECKICPPLSEFTTSERRVSPSRRSADYCTAHSIKLTFHALCNTVDETTCGFLVPAASYPADQERVWQRYQILHNLSA